MYRKHFGFTHFPFDLELQPDALFASNAITEAEARLNHLLELRAIGLITGEVRMSTVFDGKWAVSEENI